MFRLLLVASTLFLSYCTSYTLKENKAEYVSLPTAEQSSANTDAQLIQKFAPMLKIYDADQDFNKVGTPKAKSEKSVYVDSNEASVYTLKQDVNIDDRHYTNLVYRVHFSEIPFSLFPFHLSYGKNVGLIFIVTLNDANQPVLFTTVHTCGCYKAMIATPYTPEKAFPDDWTKLDTKQSVYGEELPRILKLNDENPDICVSIRPQEHRIMDAFPCNKSKQKFEQAKNYPISALRQLKTANGKTSFFHEQGYKEGFVKGATKPWESMSLSFLSLDPFVGTDKAYLRKDSSDNTFYTSLKPWNRKTTDLADFSSFLHYWGWKF